MTAIHPDRLCPTEQQQLARLRARRDIPTKQRDFMEVWGPEKPRKKPRVA